MKYSIDRIEENIAILQEIETGEIIEVETGELPEDIKEGIILSYNNNKYTIDEETTEERKNIINNRFNNLLQ